MTVDNWFAPVSCMPEWCNIIKGEEVRIKEQLHYSILYIID